jgi:asparagine synthase (glutamine-hydrolysing)
MCGICGYVGLPGDKKVIKDMTNSLFHRGPNSSGYFENELVSLGMRRLAIVDLENGTQPVFNEDRTIVTIFNGEIFNHKLLRTSLEAKGHKFNTDHSDTEVIVHLYEEYGERFPEYINGMFAIAIWDCKENKLILTRDRVGIKPLYYTVDDKNLIFGSEIKSIFKHDNVRKEPDYESLYHYFTFKNTVAPNTAYKNIQQLMPGELITYKEKKIKKFFWWKLIYKEKHNDENEVAEKLRYLLEDSVKLSMDVDVPIGAYLSGGVDSSSIVALMAKNSNRPIKTFSLIYDKNLQNKNEDRRYAKKISEIYGTNHYEYELHLKEVIDDIDAVINAFDEPFSGVTSTYFLTKLIAKHVKVALSGDGADELFGSYLAHRVAQPFRDFDEGRYDLKKLTPNFLTDATGVNAKEFIRIYREGNEVNRRMALYLWNDIEKKKLFSEKMIEICKNTKSKNLIATLYGEADTNDPLNRALYCDIKTLLPDQVLSFVDRLSMAHSVEVRPPFLDSRIIQLSCELSGNLKIKNFCTKNILKKAVKDLLPEDLINRKKEGFVLPIDIWILEKLKDYIYDTLSDTNLNKHGILNNSYVKKLIKSHYLLNENNGPKIWNLILFQKWWNQNFN